MKVFDPLESVSTSASDKPQLESNSAVLTNEEYGICPKCKIPMENAKLFGGHDSFWCANGCRVAVPQK